MGNFPAANRNAERTSVALFSYSSAHSSYSPFLPFKPYSLHNGAHLRHMTATAIKSWKFSWLSENLKNRSDNRPKLKAYRKSDIICIYLEWSFFFGDNLFDFIVSATKNCPYKELASDVINISNVFFTTIRIRGIFDVFFSLFFRIISLFLSFC